jgi:hypothetical protein
MKAIILQSSKSATQSGNSINKWILEFESDKAERYIGGHMSWTGNKDPNSQICLEFDTAQEAIYFAEKNNISYEVVMAHKRKSIKKSYAQNFL